MGPWKAVRQRLSRRNNPDPLKIELYHLAQDIGETQDVATKHPEVVQQLKSLMDSQHTPSRLFPIRALDRVSRP